MTVQRTASVSAEDTTPSTRDYAAIAQQIGANVAGPMADAVDREARFPSEAIAAMREAGLLSIFVPAEFGGEGCSISDLSTICTILGQHCSAAAMVFSGKSG